MIALEAREPCPDCILRARACPRRLWSPNGRKRRDGPVAALVIAPEGAAPGKALEDFIVGMRAADRAVPIFLIIDSPASREDEIALSRKKIYLLPAAAVRRGESPGGGEGAQRRCF